jgi:hypothetical protein
MTTRDPKRPPASPPEEPAQKPSGRVKFDSRGQAVWEWQLKTGMFDANATSQRVRALTQADLSIADTGKAPELSIDMEAGVNPYESGPAAPPGSASAATPAKKKDVPPAGGGGMDPYSSGPTKNPHGVSYNPYERTNPKKPGR